jgi:hypothetical protein
MLSAGDIFAAILGVAAQSRLDSCRKCLVSFRSTWPVRTETDDAWLQKSHAISAKQFALLFPRELDMSRLWTFLLGMIAGAALLHVATNYHVVRSSEGFDVVAKSPARLSESYVDIRSFGLADWTSHPQLAGALVQANKQHLLGDSASQAIHQSINQLLPDTLRQ